MTLRKNICIVLGCILFQSCNQQKTTTQKLNDRQVLINYLKNDFKVSPDVKQFDSYYLARLKEERKSLEIDSLINRHLSIVRCKPFHLDFVEYYPYYHYKDANKAEHYAINFIRNYKNGKIYLDFINWNAGYIIEDYCAYASIDMTRDKEISKEDINVYASINSNRRFADWELHPAVRKSGIESFLNDEFRFKKIRKGALDTLFAAYDKRDYFRYSTESLIKDPKELLQYMTRQTKRIKARYHDPESLVYLKDQINLLLAKRSRCDSVNNFQWIYISGHRIFERTVSINGSAEAFYTYSVEERTICF